MFKVISFLTNKDGLSFEDFRNHYERRHIQLVLSIAATSLLYERRYIKQDEQLTGSGPLSTSAQSPTSVLLTKPPSRQYGWSLWSTPTGATWLVRTKKDS